jgi:hypothetical protein
LYRAKASSVIRDGLKVGSVVDHRNVPSLNMVRKAMRDFPHLKEGVVLSIRYGDGSTSVEKRGIDDD